MKWTHEQPLETAKEVFDLTNLPTSHVNNDYSSIFNRSAKTSFSKGWFFFHEPSTNSFLFHNPNIWIICFPNQHPNFIKLIKSTEFIYDDFNLRILFHSHLKRIPHKNGLLKVWSQSQRNVLIVRFVIFRRNRNRAPRFRILICWFGHDQ